MRPGIGIAGELAERRLAGRWMEVVEGRMGGIGCSGSSQQVQNLWSMVVAVGHSGSAVAVEPSDPVRGKSGLERLRESLDRCGR